MLWILAAWKKRVIYSCFSCAFLAPLAAGLEFPLPAAGDDVVGQVSVVTSQKGDNLAQIGRRYNIGYVEMVAANDDLPRDAVLKRGTEVNVPAMFILPQPAKGVVVNLAELRLYYFPAGQSTVYTFPLAAGRKNWATPLADSFVVGKAANPTWTVPKSIMEESVRHGKKLKPFYSSTDPENPLGHYALYLGVTGIRIHGTLAVHSIGRRASHGCMRLWDADIQALYENVPVGTKFVILHHEAQAGWRDHILYLAVDSAFDEYHDAHAVADAIAVATRSRPAIIDQTQVDEVTAEQQGIPIAVGHDVNWVPMRVNDVPENTTNYDGE